VSIATKAANAHTVVATGWTDPSNAYATTGDNTYATIASAKNTTYSGDFGFPNFTSSDIPDNSTINSVTIYVEWGMTASVTGGTLGCQPRLNGANSGTELTKTTITEEAQSVAFGTVTLTDLRSASSLIKARCRVTKGNSTTGMTGNLDYVYLEVDYTEPTYNFSTNPTGTISTPAGTAGMLSTHVTGTTGNLGTPSGTLTDTTSRVQNLSGTVTSPTGTIDVIPYDSNPILGIEVYFIGSAL
jgi:hypothetical protein